MPETLAEAEVLLAPAFGLEAEAALEERLALAPLETAKDGTLEAEAALTVLDTTANLLLI